MTVSASATLPPPVRCGNLDTNRLNLPFAPHEIREIIEYIRVAQSEMLSSANYLAQRSPHAAAIDSLRMHASRCADLLEQLAAIELASIAGVSGGAR